MKKSIAKCGCNCSHCPSYKENLKTRDDRDCCSRGWEKYFEIKLKPEKLRACDGCAVPDKDRKVYYLNCRVRKCAIFNKVENCAYCSAYPCLDVLTIHSVQKPHAREKIEERIGHKISDRDYLSIVEPYEGIKHLNEIKKSLKSHDITEMIPVSKVPKIIPFPEKISLSNIEKSSCRQIHWIISTIEVAENVSLARLTVLEKKRKQLLKLLWAMGLHGRLEKGGEYIILDSEKYSAQKIHSYYIKVKEYTSILNKYGLNSHIIPINKRIWRTSGGALRSKGWYLKMSPKKNINKELFVTLKKYTKSINKKYGKHAFSYFSKADMRVFS